MKTKFHTTPLFLIIFCFFIAEKGLAQTACLESDSLVLVALYNSTNGPNWTNTWNLSTPVATWYGVTLEAGGCAVTCLDLDGTSNCSSDYVTGNNLVGNLTNLNLPSLQGLYLQNNELSGNIPDLSNLSNLRTLSLHNNQLSGNIPDLSNLSSLRYLYLYNNQLSGNIPDLSNLSSLRYLYLHKNQLSGNIPDLSNLSSLRYLYLNKNQLSGNIPDLSNLSNLQRIYLSSNQLSGNIPDLSNLVLLQTLNLHNNQLSGNIPNWSNPVLLQYLHLSSNQLSGNIPDLSNLVALRTLSLQNNQLSGNIPDMSNLANLQDLYLYNNQLQSLPNLQNFVNLTNLFVENNHFNFNDLRPNNFVPNYLYAPQDSLSLVKAADNQLRMNAGGIIQENTYSWYLDDVLVETIIGEEVFYPSTVGIYYCEASSTELPALTLLSKKLYAEAYVCTLAADSLELMKIYWANIGNGRTNGWDVTQPISEWAGVSLTKEGCRVDSLVISNNQIIENFPYIKLPQLHYLDISNNELTTLPAFGELPALETLILDNNNLTTLDCPILPALKHFSAVNNPLVGLPATKCIRNLNSLNLGNTSLSVIPDLSGMNSLVSLDLSNNNLTEISWLPHLCNLEILNLSYNQLSSVPDFQYLGNLQYLYLHHNQISTLPDFSGLPNLRVLLANDNHLEFLPEFANLYTLQNLRVQNNRLNFADLLPHTGLSTFLYAPQDSIALVGTGGNKLFTITGGSNNGYTWYKDGTQLPMDDTLTLQNPGLYRCVVTNPQLPLLTLYSRELNRCNTNETEEVLYLNQDICTEDDFNFLALNQSHDEYAFFYNGKIAQDSGVNEFFPKYLADGGLLSLMAYNNNCVKVSEAIPLEFNERPTVQICDFDVDSVSITIMANSANWTFDLVTYSSLDSVLNITSQNISTSSPLLIPKQANEYFEIINLEPDAQTSCLVKELGKSGHVAGAPEICVGYSNPQYECYTAIFSNPSDPNDIQWSITTANTENVVNIVGPNTGNVVHLNYFNPKPLLDTIVLQATVQTSCGNEVIQLHIKLDNDCVWPGDVNDDGIVFRDTVDWVDDATAIGVALGVQDAIVDNSPNEELINYRRAIGCGSSSKIDWKPHSSRDWIFDSLSVQAPAIFEIRDSLGENDVIIIRKNLKYADCNGNGIIESDGSYEPLSGMPFPENPTDYDVVALRAFEEVSHNGNSFKNKNMPFGELLKITPSDIVYNNGDEVRFVVTLGTSQTPVNNVSQVTFTAEATYGTHQTPSIDLSNSHLTTYRTNLVDYPFNVNNDNQNSDSLLWLTSIGRSKFDVSPAVTFSGQEVCSGVCHATVAGLVDSLNSKNSKYIDSLGFPVTFQISAAGIVSPDGTIIRTQSNKVTIYVKANPILRAKVFLEGAYDENTGMMTDHLRYSGALPTSEPYSMLGNEFYFPQGEARGISMSNRVEVLHKTGPDAVVDWVFVEIRNALFPDVIMGSRPALVTRSGDIVDLDGVSPVQLYRLPKGAYRVMIRHRNHLPVISSTTVYLDPFSPLLDFTTAPHVGQKKIDNLKYGLIAGDIDRDFDITGVDKILWSSENGYYDIYFPTDVNLDRSVDAIDIKIWNENNGKSFQAP